MRARGEREFDESSRKVGRSRGSAAMHADAKQTEFCTYLSGILLGGLSLNVPFGLWSVDRLFPQFNASQPSRPTVTGGTRFGMESTGTTRQCYRGFDGRNDPLRFQDAPSILRAASSSYTTRRTLPALAAPKTSRGVI